jgi:hypothetical protein
MQMKGKFVVVARKSLFGGRGERNCVNSYLLGYNAVQYVGSLLKTDMIEFLLITVVRISNIKNTFLLEGS